MCAVDAGLLRDLAERAVAVVAIEMIVLTGTDFHEPAASTLEHRKLLPHFPRDLDIAAAHLRKHDARDPGDCRFVTR